MNNTFDPTTVAFSGERVLKTGVDEEIFEIFALGQHKLG